MYNNPYLNYSNPYNQQSMSERIDSQIAQLQQMKEQMQKPIPQPSINQTFQLAPTHQGGIRYVNTLDEVTKENVYADTPFFSKDMSVVWIKNTKGEIKTYELAEIVAKDDKDLRIEYLQMQIEELKKGIKNESNTNVNESITKPIEDEKPTDVSNVSKPTKKSKWSTRNDK